MGDARQVGTVAWHDREAALLRTMAFAFRHIVPPTASIILSGVAAYHEAAAAQAATNGEQPSDYPSDSESDGSDETA